VARPAHRFQILPSAISFVVVDVVDSQLRPELRKKIGFAALAAFVIRFFSYVPRNRVPDERVVVSVAFLRLIDPKKIHRVVVGQGMHSQEA
jgi:hypothetical protein